MIILARLANPHSFHPDPDPAFKAEYLSGDPIRIRIQSGSRALMTKKKKKLQMKKKLNFFGSKTTIYLSLGLHKERPSYRRSLQLSEENIQHFKKHGFFSTFMGYFCPPGSGSGSTDPIEFRSNWDPDPQP
jgi:hypothetical protein